MSCDRQFCCIFKFLDHATNLTNIKSLFFPFQRPFNVNIQNETYEIFHPKILDLNLTVKNQRFFDLHFEIVNDIAHFDTGVGIDNMGYISRTIDLCSFLKNRRTNPILEISYRILTARGDLPKRCPIRKVGKMHI